MKWLPAVVFAAVVASGAFGLGWLFAPRGSGESPGAAEPAATAVATEVWTCPMHPAIRQPAPADCPICGMDLVIDDGSGADQPRTLTMSEADAKLAEIRTAPVERRFVTRELRLPGEITWDETRVRTVAARVPGRLERLFVDYTGVPVRAGDHLVVLYSPELATAQQELLEVKARLDTAVTGAGTDPFLAASDRRSYAAARAKLLDWGMAPAQVDAVEERGTAEDRIRIDSPIGGIVIDKAVEEGDYVRTGTRLYRIAELDSLWVRIEVWEQDLPWVRYGQTVTIRAEGLPGERFTGVVSFVDPVVDPRTRTVGVRANVGNADGRLKPGMFVRATIAADIAENGRVFDPSLAGKWISPMHPEIVADGPGTCDVCGMDLVPAEELGFVVAADAQPPLVVPATAVLPTGKRAVVYVEVPDAERPTFRGRVVELGPRAGDDWIIAAGVKEGERVVVNGAFKIDSALQIRAEPSMLSEPGGPVGVDAAPPLGDTSLPEAVVAALAPVYAGVVDAGIALADDSRKKSLPRFEELVAAIAAVPVDAADGAGRALLEERLADLGAAVEKARSAADLAATRAAYEDVSKAAFALHAAFGHQGPPLFEVHCPMAFDFQGASWLAREAKVQNPYFGSEMYECGTVERTLEGGAR